MQIRIRRQPIDHICPATKPSNWRHVSLRDVTRSIFSAKGQDVCLFAEKGIWDESRPFNFHLHPSGSAGAAGQGSHLSPAAEGRVQQPDMTLIWRKFVAQMWKFSVCLVFGITWRPDMTANTHTHTHRLTNDFSRLFDGR